MQQSSSDREYTEHTPFPSHVLPIKTFLDWVIPTAFAFTALAWIGSAVTAAIILASYGTIMLMARWLLHCNKWRAAISTICVSMLVTTIVIAQDQPILTPTLVFVPVLVVTLALPYASFRVFRLLLLGSWLVVVGVMLLGELRLWNNTSFTPFDAIFRATSLAAAVAIVLLLLWQFSSRLNAALARSQEAEERYSVAVRGANDGIWDWDLAKQSIYFSPRWKEMLGLADADITNGVADWYDRVHPEDRTLLHEAVAAHIKGEKEHLEQEYRIRCGDGSYRWMLCRGLAVRDHAGTVIRLAGSQTDITTRKTAEEQLRHDSLHDALTGLPNRTLFMDRLSRTIERAKRHPESMFAVLFLDLDRFKLINDSLGHTVGDTLLKVISRRLLEGMRQGDTVARLGGDEFAVLLTELPSSNSAVDIADRLQRVVDEPFKIDNHDVFTTTSIGIAISSSTYHSADEMVRDADTAMYRAKALGKACAVVFDQEMHAHVMSRLQTENELRRAIAREEFEVYYQPVVSLHTGRICGFEALLRWNHPERGCVAPSEFLLIAEETGLISPIGDWLLQEACAQIAVWQSRFPHCAPLSININLAGTQMMHPQFVSQVMQVLNEASLPPEQLALEITERVITDGDGMVKSMLNSLCDLGVKLHLDDFGTGYASLISLHDLPISAVKIDRAFVSAMDAAPQNSAIVRAIVALSQNLGLEVIAEGVETSKQLAVLHAIGCDYSQGYYFSEPQDAVTTEALLSASEHWPHHDHLMPQIALPPISSHKAFPCTLA